MVIVFLRPEDRAQRTHLGLAEAVVEAELGQTLPQLRKHRSGHDRGTVVGLAQTLQVTGIEVGTVGQGNPYRGGGEEGVDLTFFEQRRLRGTGAGTTMLCAPMARSGIRKTCIWAEW